MRTYKSMLFIAYTIFLLCILFYIMGWYLDSKFQVIPTAFLIFSLLAIFGIYTSIYAYQYEMTDSLFPFMVYVYSFLTFYGGYFVTNMIFKRKRHEVVFKRDTSFVEKSENDFERYFVPILILMVLLILIGTFHYQGLPPITQIFRNFISGNMTREAAVDFKLDRINLTKSHYFGGEYRGQGLIRVVSRVGWSYLLALTFTVYHNVKSKKWFGLLALTLLLSVIYVAGDGSRALIVQVLLHLFISMAFLMKMKLKQIIKLALVLIAFLIGLSFMSLKLYDVMASGQNVLVTSIKTIVERIVIGYSINDIWIINLIKDNVFAYQYGRLHFSQFVNSFPGVSGYESFSYILGQLIGSTGSTTYASPTYLGLAFADVGSIGVCIIYFVMGTFMTLVQNYFYSLRKDCLNLTIMTFIILLLGWLPITGIIKFMPEFIVVVAIHIFMKTLSKVRVKSKAKINYHNRKLIESKVGGTYEINRY